MSSAGTQQTRERLIAQIVDALGIDPDSARKAVLLAETCPDQSTYPASASPAPTRAAGPGR